jgi:hypothetical protein
VTDTVDDCSACEGWSELDHRGLCPTCADSLDNDPWMIVRAFNGEVADPGPYPQELARHIEHVHNHAPYTSQPRWEARRIAS